MERKAFGLGSVTLIACASVGLVVLACGETESSTFPGDSVDASTESPPVFGGSSGTSSSGTVGDGGTPGAKCEPVIADGYKANFKVPAAPPAPGPCTDTTIGTYYDECIGTLGQADNKTRCDAWKAANAACGACIEPTDNTGPIQWHRDRFYYTLNVGGCIAVQQAKFAETDCGYAYGAALNCARDACAGCFETGKSTFNDFLNCQNAADMVGLCKSLQTQVGAACTDVQTTDPTKGCFNANNAEDAKVHRSRVIGYFCAKP
jgi:hypothetical protein